LTYVENAVDGIYKASVNPRAVGQIYNLVDDGEITARDYLEQSVKITGVETRIVAMPYLVAYLATTAYEIAPSLNLLKKGITSRRQLRLETQVRTFRKSKAKNELGWEPNVYLQQGLTQTFEWYSRQRRSS